MNLLRPSVELAMDIDALTKRRGELLELSGLKNQWIKSVRQAIGLPGRAMAARMEISQAALQKLEEREAAGTITIERLEALANALECDFVYAFVPRASLAASASELEAERKEAFRAHRKLPRIT